MEGDKDILSEIFRSKSHYIITINKQQELPGLHWLSQIHLFSRQKWDEESVDITEGDSIQHIGCQKHYLLPHYCCLLLLQPAMAATVRGTCHRIQDPWQLIWIYGCMKKLMFINSFMLQNLQNIYTAIYIHVYINTSTRTSSDFPPTLFELAYPQTLHEVALVQ